MKPNKNICIMDGVDLSDEIKIKIISAQANETVHFYTQLTPGFQMYAFDLAFRFIYKYVFNSIT